MVMQKWGLHGSFGEKLAEAMKKAQNDLGCRRDMLPSTEPRTAFLEPETVSVGTSTLGPLLGPFWARNCLSRNLPLGLLFGAFFVPESVSVGTGPWDSFSGPFVGHDGKDDDDGKRRLTTNGDGRATPGRESGTPGHCPFFIPR